VSISQLARILEVDEEALRQEFEEFKANLEGFIPNEEDILIIFARTKGVELQVSTAEIKPIALWNVGDKVRIEGYILSLYMWEKEGKRGVGTLVALAPQGICRVLFFGKAGEKFISIMPDVETIMFDKLVTDAEVLDTQSRPPAAKVYGYLSDTIQFTEGNKFEREEYLPILHHPPTFQEFGVAMGVAKTFDIRSYEGCSVCKRKTSINPSPCHNAGTQMWYFGNFTLERIDGGRIRCHVPPTAIDFSIYFRDVVEVFAEEREGTLLVHSIRNPSKGEQIRYIIRSRGTDNRISFSELASIMNVRNQRRYEEMIARLVEAGELDYDPAEEVLKIPSR